MDPFAKVTGVAAPLPEPNIDTDVIMPKQFLKGIDREGLARGLFHDQRFTPAGEERPDFILNRRPYRSAAFLIVGPNFGCGSSREHAVWGLRQFGVRAIVGTSFASIFQDNCFKNGLLVISLSTPTVASLQARCAVAGTSRIEIDLIEQRIHLDDDAAIDFVVDPLHRDDLLAGRDAISLGLERLPAIESFEARHWSASPWFIPMSPEEVAGR